MPKKKSSDNVPVKGPSTLSSTKEASSPLKKTNFNRGAPPDSPTSQLVLVTPPATPNKSVNVYAKKPARRRPIINYSKRGNEASNIYTAHVSC